MHFGRRGVAKGSPVELDYKYDINSIRMTANLKDHINEVNVFWGDVEKDGTRMTKVTYKSPPKPINSGGTIGLQYWKDNFWCKICYSRGYDSPVYKIKVQQEQKRRQNLKLQPSILWKE